MYFETWLWQIDLEQACTVQAFSRKAPSGEDKRRQQARLSSCLVHPISLFAFGSKVVWTQAHVRLIPTVVSAANKIRREPGMVDLT